MRVLVHLSVSSPLSCVFIFHLCSSSLLHCILLLLHILSYLCHLLHPISTCCSWYPWLVESRVSWYSSATAVRPLDPPHTHTLLHELNTIYMPHFISEQNIWRAGFSKDLSSADREVYYAAVVQTGDWTEASTVIQKKHTDERKGGIQMVQQNNSLHSVTGT